MTCKQVFHLAACILLVACLSPLLAEDDKSSSKTSPWKPEDIVYAESVDQFRISPDGKWLVWMKSAGDKEKDAQVSNLFLSSLTEDREIQLTRGNDDNTSPRWSPNGDWIAYLSSRPHHGTKPESAATQIWLINPRGGEPYALTELPRAPEELDWIDQDTVIFSVPEDPGSYEQVQKSKKDDSEVVDDADHKPPVRLFKINIKDKRVTRLTSNTDWISRWSVSRDGKFVVAVHSRSLHYEFDQKIPPVTVLYNLADGTEKQLFREGRIRPSDFRWAPDNSGFYFAAPFSNDPKFLEATISLLYFYELASGRLQQVPLHWENGLGPRFVPTRDGLVALLAAGHRFGISAYRRGKANDTWNWERRPLAGSHADAIQAFEINPDGKTLVFLHSTASQMPQLYRAQLDGEEIASPVVLSRINESLVKSRTFSKTEVVRWKGSNNEEVEGILYYPANFEAGKRYPLITAIHGGPAGWNMDAWGDDWAYPINLLTQKGTFVLRPNYHGSGNYGLKWVESICCGKYYDLETPDINLGVDYLIGKGLVDAGRVATLGWSNGSILSTSLITTYPERYKVASVGAGDVEWISDWGNVTFGDSFDSYYFGKSPMEDPDLYIRKSPFFKLDRVRAPVLIFHGAADVSVPPAQSWSYFRALQYYGKVPVKFVVFPGEPHGPKKLTHQMRKVEEEAAWFDRYFFKTEPIENEAVKAGSPLDAALRSRNAARTGGLYGAAYSVKGKSILIPEVVVRGDLEIGRFEVTRAQFAAFDKTYKVESGGENYPANGIRLDQAKAYADWLSKSTGQIWRIPQEAETAGQYDRKDGENTLDYWAGYALNPDDANRLRRSIKELPGAAPLLKPVGSFAGQAQDAQGPIFDLGGNVAEWVLTPDGKGKVAGGSADCPADPRSSCAAAPEYVGFRVVRGAAKSSAGKH